MKNSVFTGRDIKQRIDNLEKEVSDLYSALDRIHPIVSTSEKKRALSVWENLKDDAVNVVLTIYKNKLKELEQSYSEEYSKANEIGTKIQI